MVEEKISPLRLTVRDMSDLMTDLQNDQLKTQSSSKSDIESLNRKMEFMATHCEKILDRLKKNQESMSELIRKEGAFKTLQYNILMSRRTFEY